MSRTSVFVNAIGAAGAIAGVLLAADCGIWNHVCPVRSETTAALPFSVDEPNEAAGASSATLTGVDTLRQCLSERLLAHEVAGHAPSYAICADWQMETNPFLSDVAVSFGTPAASGIVAEFRCMNPDQISIAHYPEMPAAALVCNYPQDLRGSPDMAAQPSHIMAAVYSAGSREARVTILADGSYFYAEPAGFSAEPNEMILSFRTNGARIWPAIDPEQAIDLPGGGERETSGHLIAAFSDSGSLAGIRLR
ncbi:hypothetical protein GCM10007420_22050 [Glycocaulis albus]|uniref:Uncharacterized protein n=1 Tax=Glycocaulis albus TaxID=1382801 RepID=A0ABQ1XW84_9PROT|nr:hypothetical protein [Glycocaulis albus]GGH05173.1 hypothetical protein GCM10007420_22050 [Glycocaulis albus]